jgi:hypothetical protein
MAAWKNQKCSGFCDLPWGRGILISGLAWEMNEGVRGRGKTVREKFCLWGYFGGLPLGVKGGFKPCV